MPFQKRSAGNNYRYYDDTSTSPGGLPNEVNLDVPYRRTAELDLNRGKTYAHNLEGRGYYDTNKALQGAYGAPAEDVRQLIDHANSVRRGDPQFYGLHRIPSKIPFDTTNRAVANGTAAAVGNTMSDALRSIAPSKLEKYVPDGSRLAGMLVNTEFNNELADKLSNEVGHFASDLGSAGDLAKLYEKGYEAPSSIIHTTGGGLKSALKDRESGAYASGGSVTYNGFNNPYTGLNVARYGTQTAVNGHEATHVLQHGESGNQSDNVRKAYDVNKSIVDQNPDIAGRSTYGAYSVSEATQNAAQIKRLAYNQFYAKNGRLPRGYNEISNAYRDVTRYNVKGTPGHDPNFNPANAEHVRFINYMTPSDPNLTPQQRQEQYNNNVNNWINQMMEKDRNGNFYQDSLVRATPASQVKMASVGSRWNSCLCKSGCLSHGVLRAAFAEYMATQVQK